MKHKTLIIFILLLLSAIASPTASAVPASAFEQSNVADAGAESITDLTAHAKHFDAMVALYRSDSEQLTLGDRLAAAKSAWALGLVRTARQLWDEALADPSFQETDRYRTTLARAIVELQENGYDKARSIAERAASHLEASDLRAQFWLVIAESLKEQGALSLSEGYYRKALADGSKQLKNEARFLLAECQLKLGLTNDARYSLAGVEVGSKYTGSALKRLMEIDLSQKNYEGVVTWVEEGREARPDEFADGWTSYALVTSLVELGKTGQAMKELHELKVRLSEKNSWYPLAEAAIEGKLVGQIYAPAVPEARAKQS